MRSIPTSILDEDDLIAEALLCLCRSTGWCHTIPFDRYVAMSINRHLGKVAKRAVERFRARRPFDGWTLPDSRDSLADADDREEVATLALGRLHLLTERQRQAISLYYLDGLGCGEVAARLGIDKSNADKLRARAIIKLRKDSL